MPFINRIEMEYQYSIEKSALVAVAVTLIPLYPTTLFIVYMTSSSFVCDPLLTGLLLGSSVMIAIDQTANFRQSLT